MRVFVKSIFFLFAVASIQFFSASHSYADTRTCAQGGVCVVGDTGPGGGKVFFVKSTGSFTKSRTVTGFMSTTTYTVALTSAEQAALSFDYLEVAPTQRSLGFWGSNGAVTGDTSELIGTGALNTSKIISTFTSDNITNNAAIYADQYTNGGKSDWHLPSYQEILLMMILSLESDSGGPSIGSFSQGLWSSSSMDPTTARYSARGQLSGYVTRGTNSGGVAAIRSFSYTEPPANESADDAAAKKRAEELRAARIREARLAIQRQLESQGIITEQNLIDADIPLKKPESMIAVYNELIAFQKSQGSPLPELEQNQKKRFTVMKYSLAEKITSSTNPRVFARDLVDYGLLSTDTPQKTRIIWKILRVEQEQRDSIEKFNALVAKEVAIVNARRERLAARLAQ